MMHNLKTFLTGFQKQKNDFKNFLEHDNFDSKQPDKKIKKNIEKDL